MKSLANGQSGTVNAASAPSPASGAFYVPQRVREDQKKLGAKTALKLLESREEAAKAGAKGGGALPRADRQAVEALWLRVDQVAKRLNLDAKYIYRLIGSGQLQAVNFGKRMWRVREDMLARFINERSEVSLPELAERWDRDAAAARHA
jgi:excisionase family DNA binding protein